jgi:predicted DsbA family dithiol-disulfide isomerase
MLPYVIPKAIFSFFKGEKDLTEEEIAQKIMEEHGLTMEEYEAELAKSQQKREQWQTSAKAKRYRRFMKKM